MAGAQFGTLLEILEKVGRMLGVESWIIEELRKPEVPPIIREYSVRLASGESKNIRVCCVLYNKTLGGPYKGGITRVSRLDPNQVLVKAFLMVFKAALVRVPFGGAKTAFEVNPEDYADEGNAERIVKEMVWALRDVIGPQNYVPAPDRGTSSREMAWILAAYEEIFELHQQISGPQGRLCPRGSTWGVATGKPLVLHGSEGRETATARGGQFVLRQALRDARQFGIPFTETKGLRIVIQGFGNVGYHFADLIQQDRALVIAVSDSKGGVYNPGGLDISRLKEHKDRTGSVLDFPGSQNLTNEELLLPECDVLAPAAVENVITLENAKDIRARILLELGNAVTDPRADQALMDKGVIILPDILANAGGLTISHFEWAQNNAGDQWLYHNIDTKLEFTMNTATHRVLQTAKDYKVSNRFAAYIEAIKFLAQARRSRGQYKLSDSRPEFLSS